MKVRHRGLPPKVVDVSSFDHCSEPNSILKTGFASACIIVVFYRKGHIGLGHFYKLKGRVIVRKKGFKMGIRESRIIHEAFGGW